MNFLEKVRGFLLEPSDTFDISKDDALSVAIKYYVIIVVIYSALLTLLYALGSSLLGPMMGLERPVVLADVDAGVEVIMVLGFVMVLTVGIIAPFLAGALIHVGVYMMGGRNGITQTMKAAMYGSTPLLFSWIPIIGAIAGIWVLILEIIGIRQLQDLTTGRAIMAVLVPIITIAVIIILAAVIGVFMFGMRPV